jgi:hypothetical protein
MATAARTLRKVIVPAPATNSRLTLLVAAVLLFIFWWQAVSASVHWSQTSDELPHIAGGYAYDKFGDFRIQPENGNLPQRVHGLAPLALGAKFPMNEDWWRNSTYWQLGWDQLYNLGNDTDRIVHYARALNALFGAALGAFVFFVARRWHGDWGGLLALGFYALCPNFLAHSALATSDAAGALMLTLAPWFFWRHLERRDAASGAVAGLFSGLALVAKFNGVLLAPIYAVLAALDAWGRAAPGARVTRFGRNFALCLAQAFVGVLVIWAFFNFRFAAQGAGVPPLDRFAWSWPEMLSGLGWKAGFIQFALDWKLLPQAWLYGLTNVLAGEVARPAFFAGEYRLTGWWEFFPTLFLAKTPLAMLAGLLAAGGAALWAWRGANAAARTAHLLRVAPLAVPALVVGGTALLSNLNIGHRHILAAYPVLFVALGGLALWPRRWLAIPVLLLAGQAAESWIIRPHYLAFFNPLLGGPGRAHRLVVDSSLDWGQGLPALRDWLKANRRPGEKLHLAYFGSAWPPHYGVRPDVFLPESSNVVRPPFTPHELEPGIYAVSATSLSGVYSGMRGPWRPEWEAAYRAAPRDGEEFARLRFARLCRYLQTRKPDDQAGFSILLYRLKEDEIRQALDGPVKGW